MHLNGSKFPFGLVHLLTCISSPTYPEDMNILPHSVSVFLSPVAMMCMSGGGY